jgi:FAD/FMN-containing dehydrogenase
MGGEELDASRAGDTGAETAGRFGRRGFLAGAAGVAALGAVQWTPIGQITAAMAAGTAPPGFPASIPLVQQVYENWSGEIHVDAVWTAVPASAADVVTIANWARSAGYRIRAKGKSHNWSPIVIPNGAATANTVLVDTTAHLTAVTVHAGSPATVTAGTGVTMEQLLTTLESSGYGLTATPAPGQLTLGGVLAIDGHGTAVPATGETRPSGMTYGTVSNLITSLTAVVWDSASSSYVLRTFNRNDAAIAPLLAHVGRSFVTEVTLQVGANQRLRCQSWFDISADVMFGSPGSNSKNFANYINRTGRAEAIWFPFTGNPWLKVWSVSPTKPLLSKQVNSPYNYTFADSLSAAASNLVSQIIAGNVGLTPTFENTQISVVGSGLITTGTWDIWGWSKNVQLYVRPSTLRVTANGYAIVTKRSNIQRVVNEFYVYLKAKLAAYQALGRFPMNGPLEIRVTGLDKATDVAVAGAKEPQLSALRPRPDHTDWDVAVWLDLLTIPGTPYANQFYAEVEQWVLSNYSGTYAAVRPEWSKGWGYTNTAAWTNSSVIGTTIPNAYRAGQAAGDNWDSALAALDAYDPHHIFTNDWLNGLMP